jgi:hypothetical protein
MKIQSLSWDMYGGVKPIQSLSWDMYGGVNPINVAPTRNKQEPAHIRFF